MCRRQKSDRPRIGEGKEEQEVPRESELASVNIQRVFISITPEDMKLRLSVTAHLDRVTKSPSQSMIGPVICR